METFPIQRTSRTVTFETGESFQVFEMSAPDMVAFTGDMQSVGILGPDSGKDPANEVDAATVPLEEIVEAKQALITKWVPKILSARVGEPPVDESLSVLSRGLTFGEFEGLMTQQLIVNAWFRTLGEQRRFAARTASETPTTPSP